MSHLAISASLLEKFRLSQLEDSFVTDADVTAAVLGQRVDTRKMAIGRALQDALRGSPAAMPSSEMEQDVMLPDDLPYRSVERRGLDEVPARWLAEIRGQQVSVGCRADHVYGDVVEEWKALLRSFDFDTFGDSMQWRCYLLAFDGAAVVRYKIFQFSDLKAGLRFDELHSMAFQPYPLLREDVAGELEDLVDWLTAEGLADKLRRE